MSLAPPASPPPSPAARLMRGYGPLFGFAVLFMLMAALVPTVGTEIRTVAAAGPGSAGPGGGGPTAGDGSPADPGASAARGQPGVSGDGDGTTATSGSARGGSSAAGGSGGVAGSGGDSDRRAGGGGGGSPGGSGATAGGSGATGSGAAGSGAAGRAAGPPSPGGKQGAATIGGCTNRKAQVANDPYSPPCIAFSGDNGGATYRGVTPTEIIISARMASLPDFSAIPSDSGPAASFSANPEEIKRTIDGLAEYFNSRFQFYGRKLRVVPFDGKGSFMTELQGGGQEAVEADAVRAAEEVNAFADIFGFTAPYSDALARRGLMSLGALFMSQEWFAQRRPYVWSPTPDCTFIQQTVSDYVNKRLAGKPARYAGGDLKGKARTTTILVPENPWYQECADAGDKVARDAGHPNQPRITYKLDLNTLSNQAASMVAKLKSQKITTVICGCDPAIPIFLTAKAKEQGYSPEWLITGAGFTDLDVFGQLYEQDQWSRSLGVSFTGPLQPLRGATGYHAFKAVRPNEEPSSLVEFMYYNMYLLAAGIQHAGPNLRPETFERGMYAYPGGSGPAGTWKFTPGRHTPTQDAREIYWDRNATSPQNKEKGSYVDPNRGKRYRPGEWPTTDPSVPER